MPRKRLFVQIAITPEQQARLVQIAKEYGIGDSAPAGARFVLGMGFRELRKDKAGESMVSAMHEVAEAARAETRLHRSQLPGFRKLAK